MLRIWRMVRAVAIDSTVVGARGGVWHKKDRETGVVPHSLIDTEAAWTKSRWVYGWKLHVVAVVASVWLPLAADLTPANIADNDQALTLLPELLVDARFMLGERHYNALRKRNSGALPMYDFAELPAPATKTKAEYGSHPCARR